MRSISEVAVNLLGLSIYQLGAKIAAIRGDATTINRVSNIRHRPKLPATRLTSCLTAAALPFSRYSPKIGTKA